MKSQELLAQVEKFQQEDVHDNFSIIVWEVLGASFWQSLEHLCSWSLPLHAPAGLECWLPFPCDLLALGIAPRFLWSLWCLGVGVCRVITVQISANQPALLSTKSLWWSKSMGLSRLCDIMQELWQLPACVIWIVVSFQIYLKEILREIGIYNVKGTHKNTWELKPEYRHYQEEKSD